MRRSLPDQSTPPPAWSPPVCAECGSARLRTFFGYFGSGVFAPDGSEETYWRDAIQCLQCGFTEEFS